MALATSLEGTQKSEKSLATQGVCGGSAFWQHIVLEYIQNMCDPQRGPLDRFDDLPFHYLAYSTVSKCSIDKYLYTKALRRSLDGSKNKGTRVDETDLLLMVCFLEIYCSRNRLAWKYIVSLVTISFTNGV